MDFTGLHWLYVETLFFRKLKNLIAARSQSNDQVAIRYEKCALASTLSQ